MYKSLKINLHLAQIVYLQIDFSKKKLSKNHFPTKGRNLTNLKNLF